MAKFGKIAAAGGKAVGAVERGTIAAWHKLVTLNDEIVAGMRQMFGEDLVLAGEAGRMPTVKTPKVNAGEVGNIKGDNILEARMKPEEVLTPKELQKLKDLAGYRETEGLPEYKYRQKTGTTAETEINGEKSQGVNTKTERERLNVDSSQARKATLEALQKIEKLKGVKYGDDLAQFLTHAEAQALMNAAEKAGGKLPQKMT